MCITGGDHPHLAIGQQSGAFDIVNLHDFKKVVSCKSKEKLKNIFKVEASIKKENEVYCGTQNGLFSIKYAKEGNQITKCAIRSQVYLQGKIVSDFKEVQNGKIVTSYKGQEIIFIIDTINGTTKEI
jgi:hypothetical protein